MSDIFNSQPGKVVRLRGPSDTALVSVDGLSQTGVIVITGAHYEQSGRIQYKPTIGGSVFVYPLGDNMGKLIIKGSAFEEDCDGANNGFANIVNYYNRNKATKKGADPIEIRLSSYPDQPIRGFLEALSAEAAAAELNYWSWALHVGTIPQSRN